MTGTVNGKITYSHNGFFELTGMKVNNRSEINYEYDRDGLLTKAGDLNITRSPVHGQIVKSDLGFVTTGRGYTENGELHYEQYNAGRQLYMYVLNEKDSVGRITFRRDTVEKETEEGKKPVTDEYMYEYNSRGYLQRIYDAETGTAIFTASYDLNGNRTYVYNPHHKYNGGYPLYDSQDRLLSYGDYRYEYTEHGALSKKRDVNGTPFDQADDTFTAYSYDHGGNLLKVNLPNNDEIRYTSDALNRRIAKQVNGTYEYKLLYSGQLSPIARLDADSRVVEEYVYGSRVNVPEYMIKDSRKYRFITDHRGSVRMVVDTHTGEVMQRTDYDEFGLIIDETLAENWTPVLFGYAGGLQDRDTGLVRFGARDYDPMVGRWTSKEPLGFNGSSNFYVYAENDPVNFVDVNGLAPYKCSSLEDAVLNGSSDI
ncbi:MAG TPA: RHS repeat-associated core domain-containing protein, partial [bacterium]|nr:RHS repeat-associated core domain-containing protein [bacterium]